MEPWYKVATPRREVREETGLDVRIERKVGEIEYWFTRAEQGKRFRKRVHYFLMTPIEFAGPCLKAVQPPTSTATQ